MKEASLLWQRSAVAVGPRWLHGALAGGGDCHPLEPGPVRIRTGMLVWAVSLWPGSVRTAARRQGGPASPWWAHS